MLSMSFRSALAFFLAGICLSVSAEEILLYERNIPEQERKYFEFSSFEKKFDLNYTLDGLKQAYQGTSENPWIIRLVAIRAEGEQFYHLVRITTRKVRSIATIYERQLPREDLEQYALAEAQGPTLEPTMSVDDITRKYGPEYWDWEWGVQRVEVYFGGALEGKYDKNPRFRVFRLNLCPLKTEAEKKQEQEWIEMAKQKLALGKDAAGLKIMSTECKTVERWSTVERDGPIPWGQVLERFRVPNRGEVIARIEQWLGDSVPDHEALRGVMYLEWQWKMAPFEVKKMAPGYVLASGDVIIYISGNCYVYLQSEACSPKQMAKLYADKLPSTLPKKIDLDKTKWYREEAEAILARLKDLAALDKPTRFDLFNWNFTQLLNTVHFPDLQPNVARKATVEKKQELYGKVAAWWQENKDKTVWSKEVGKLVVKQE